MIIKLISNLSFWSSLSGLLGAILIFFYGLPSKINSDGHINLILEQEDKNEKRMGKLFRLRSYFGISLIILSFLLQVLLFLSA